MVAVGGALLLSQTGMFREWVRGFAEKSVNGAINGKLSIGALEGTFFSWLTLRDVRLAGADGKTMVSVKSAELTLALADLLHLKANVPMLRLTGVDATIRDLNGTLNVATLAKPGPPAPEPAPGEPFSLPALIAQVRSYGLNGVSASIGEVSIHNGRFRFERVDANETAVLADIADLHLDVTAAARVSGDNLPEALLRIRNLSARPVVPALPPVRLFAQIRAALDFAEVEELSLRMGEDSGIHVRGRANAQPFDAPQVALDLFAWLSDMNALAAVLPAKMPLGPVELTASIHGGLEDANISLFARLPGGTIDLKARGGIPGGMPCIDTHLSFMGVDPSPWTAIAGVDLPPMLLNGELFASGGGAKIEDLQLEAQAGIYRSTVAGQYVPSIWLRVNGTGDLSGRFSLDGDIGGGSIRIRGDARAAGFANPASAAEAHAIIGVHRLNLAGIVPGGPTASDLTLTGLFAASKSAGESLKSIAASGSFRMADSWLEMPGLRNRLDIGFIDLNTTLRGERLSVMPARVSAMGVTLLATGEAGMDGPVSAEVDLRVGSWDFLSLLPQSVPRLAGEVDVAAAVHGTWDRLDPSATIVWKRGAVRDMTWREIAMRASAQGIDAARFNLAAMMADANVTVSSFETNGQKVQRLSLRAAVANDEVRLVADAFSDGRTVGLTGTVSPLLGDPWRVRLSRLEASVPPLELRNRGPVSVDAGTRLVRIHELALVGDHLRLAALGELHLNGDMNLTLNLHDLRLRPVLDAAKLDQPLDGVLTLDARAVGPLQRPRLDAAIFGYGVKYGDFPVLDLRMLANSTGERVSATVDVRALDQLLLHVEADAPVKVGVPPPSDMLDTASPLRGHVAFGPFDLRRLSDLPQALRDKLPGTFTGNVRLRGDIGGTLASPESGVALAARDVVFAPKDAASLSIPPLNADVNVTFRSSEATLLARVDVGGERWVHAQSRMPMRLGYPLPAEMLPAQTPLDANVSLHIGNMARLEPFLSPIRGHLAGMLDASVTARGTLGAPLLAGGIRWRNGWLRSKDVGIDYQNIDLNLSMTQDCISLHGLSLFSEANPTKGGVLAALTGAQSVRGALLTRGTVGLAEFKPTTLDLLVDLDSFPPLIDPERFAVVDGHISARGDRSCLQVEGELAVENGRVTIPDFMNQEKSPDVVVSGEPEAANEVTFRKGRTLPPADFLALNVRLRIPGRFFLVNAQSNIELEGDVLAKKDCNGPFALEGNVETKRGFVEFLGKEFQISRGRVDLTGGTAINPVLDIEAKYLVKGASTGVEILLLVKGQATSPEISLDSNPPLEDADRISYLLFGKPQSELGEGQGGSLEGQAVGMLSGALAGQLNQVLGKSLALDVLKVRTGSEGLSDGSVTAGKYLSDRVFVSATQGFDEEAVTTIAIEYALLKWLKLVGSAGTDRSTGTDLVVEHEY